MKFVEICIVQIIFFNLDYNEIDKKLPDKKINFKLASVK